MSQDDSIEVIHNPGRQRFEAQVDGDLAVTEYRLHDRVITFTHTLVPPGAQGGGVGNRLAAAALDHARSEGLRVVSECRFISAFIRRNPDYQLLLRTD